MIDSTIVRANQQSTECQAIGRSSGGLSTKIHATCNALGNPTSFFLFLGQAHDLVGADALLPKVAADAFLADKAYDADERVIQKLKSKILFQLYRLNLMQKTSEYNILYKCQHLIENFSKN